MDLIVEFFETFKENYLPADNFASATDYLTTDEICDIIDTNGVLFTDRLKMYEFLILSGYKQDLIPSAPPQYKWLIIKK